MVLGTVKGYDIKEINKKKIAGVNLSEELERMISKEKLTEKMEQALSEGGRVYALYQNKMMTVCYIFSKSSENDDQNADEPNDSLDDRNDTEKDEPKKQKKSDRKEKDQKKKSILTLTDTFIPEQHQKSIEAFDKALLDELKEVMVFYEIQYVVFKDKKYSQKTYHTPFGTISGVALGFGIGIALGMFCLDSGFMGLALGIAFAVMWGIIFSENDTIENVDKKKDEENDQKDETED